MQGRACFRRRLVGLALAFGCLVGALHARSEELPEYRLKAAFLYNFAAFTEWPEELGPTLSICLFGPDSFASEIDSLAGKAAGSRKIEIHRKTSLEALKNCQVVFVAASTIGHMPRLLDALHGLPILVVADSPGAVQQGAMLNMNVVQGRVTFEANLAAARNARLNLSSKLLRLATEVIQ